MAESGSTSIIQDNILNLYNDLVMFNDTTVMSDHPVPITVKFDSKIMGGVLILSQRDLTLTTSLPCYFSLDLSDLEKKPAYLLPDDYYKLMLGLQNILKSNYILTSNVLLCPKRFGFSVYYIEPRKLSLGPQLLGDIKLISGRSKLFKLITRLKFNTKEPW